MSDPVVGRALAVLHEKPAAAWTLSSLAKRVGASRSGLADRFARLVGKPPMQYLTAWRMQAATELLGHAAAKVAAVASEVGYDSEAAFSRAFKKATGMAPAARRDQHARGINTGAPPARRAARGRAPSAP